MNDTINKINQLRAKGWSGMKIFKQLSEEKAKGSNGGKLTKSYVLYHAYKKPAKTTKVVDHGPLPKKQRTQKTPKASMRFIALVGAPEDVLAALRGM